MEPAGSGDKRRRAVGPAAHSSSEFHMKIPLELPPGLNGDDTTLAGAGRWADGSNVRFRLGRAETIGGWERLTSESLSGVCRAVFPWTDNAGTLNIAFGTHSTLELWRGGETYDPRPGSPPAPSTAQGRRASARAVTASAAMGCPRSPTSSR